MRMIGSIVDVYKTFWLGMMNSYTTSKFYSSHHVLFSQIAKSKFFESNKQLVIHNNCNCKMSFNKYHIKKKIKVKVKVIKEKLTF